MRTSEIETDCCSTSTATSGAVNTVEAITADPHNAPAPQDDPRQGCVNCGQASRPVTRKTMLLMLKPELFERVSDDNYRFCSDPYCRIVYFMEGEGATFTTEDLRVRVGLKEREDPIPLCYCFGFYEADAREEIARIGVTTIPQRITALIKQGMCACPERNPSGACCLGEVNKAVKQLLSEAAK
jgi:hypothetical protein